MTVCNLFVSGRVVWAGPEKATKNDRPMKTVLVTVDDDREWPRQHAAIRSA